VARRPVIAYLFPCYLNIELDRENQIKPYNIDIYVLSTRQNLAQTKIFPVFFSVNCKAGSKVRERPPSVTNSDLQFEAEVEVSDLEIEPDGRRA
jgi:hypothetical protein